MAIYLQATGFQGNVTTKGFQNWIELSSVNFTGIQLDAQMQVGRGSRLVGNTHFGSFIITKPLDKSSITFFDRIVAATVIPSMTIAYVTTGSNLNTYQKYQLKNVMITQLDDASSFGQDQHPKERIALNYEAIEKTFIPYDEKNRPGSPLISAYDLLEAKVS